MFRSLLIALLALVMALTSVTAAVARGQAAGVTEMVICSGYGVVTVTLDAQGNPTGPVHSCPVCHAALGPAVLPEAPQLSRPLSRALRLELPAERSGSGRTQPEPTARGPPTVV